MVRRALQRAEFVIVQEAFATTATCDYADLLLPATTWGEKDGTVTNSERRISRVRAAVPPAGEARHDWRIAVDVARRLEAALASARTDALSVRITGASLERAPRIDARPRPRHHRPELRACWTPRPAAVAAARRRDRPARRACTKTAVFATADGRARFADVPFKPLAEPRDARYPFSLTTGRLRDQWHGMSRTGTLGRLFGHVAEPAVEMHAQRHGAPARWPTATWCTSRRGAARSCCRRAPAPQVAPRQAFVAMHWGEEFVDAARRSTC